EAAERGRKNRPLNLCRPRCPGAGRPSPGPRRKTLRPDKRVRRRFSGETFADAGGRGAGFGAAQIFASEPGCDRIKFVRIERDTEARGWRKSGCVSTNCSEGWVSGRGRRSGNWSKRGE